MAPALVALTLLFAVASAASVPVSANWQWEGGGFKIEFSYRLQVDVEVDREWIYAPGEEVALSVTASRGVLEISVRPPWGEPFRQSIDLPPGGVWRVSTNPLPGVVLEVYIKMSISAAVYAKGAEPSNATSEIPTSLRFKVVGTGAYFNVTFYATPTLGLNLHLAGATVEVFKGELARVEMAPVVEKRVSMFPWPVLTAAAAAAAAFLIWRRRKLR
ncbi:MAG: hypothetical protein QXR64_05525 [Pyrobaculum sp.]